MKGITMKKSLIGIAAVAAILLTAGCSAAGDDASKGNEESSTANTAVDLSKLGVNDDAKALVPADIAERGTVIVGVDATYPPNEFKDEAGNAIGWEVDMVAAAITRMGLEPELKIAKFENIVPNIELGKFDLGLSLIHISSSRASWSVYRCRLSRCVPGEALGRSDLVGSRVVPQPQARVNGFLLRHQICR